MAEKGGSNEAQDDRPRRRMAILLISVLSLIIATSAVLIVPKAIHPRFDVGVILSAGCTDEDATAVMSGITIYDDYFDPVILPGRFSSDGIRTLNGFNLTSDIVRSSGALSSYMEWELDIIVVVFDGRILNWDGDGKAFWGQAFTEWSVALLTTSYWNSSKPVEITCIQHIVLHEIFHLFGYRHNVLDPDDIMKYAENTDQTHLGYVNEFQMPFRSLLFPVLEGRSVGTTFILFNSFISLAFVPVFVALEILFSFVHSHPFKPSYILTLVSAADVFIAFMLIESINGGFLAFVLPLVIILLMHLGLRIWESWVKRVNS
ncbi:MAG: zinc-dependent metalloprotease [Candidatus Thermoplasmatota archaeon]|jgi:hypothetical protein|nr:zinc-dependent metalloprotease [Candidatus Thermoplasmatota archaeon]